MRTILFSLCLLGCSGDVFTGLPDIGKFDPDADPPPSEASALDSGRDAPSSDADAVSDDAQADTMMCPYQGAKTCSDVIAAYCTHYASCCAQQPGNGFCFSWGSDKTMCTQHFAQNGMDCQSGKYQKCVGNSGLACATDIQGASCTAIFQSSGPSSFPSCPAFWGQF